MSFNFGNNPAKTTAGPILGSPATTATTATGFSIGTPSGLTFGSTTSNVPGAFSLGAGDSKSATPTTATVKPLAATAPLGSTFSLGATPATTAPVVSAVPTAAAAVAPQTSTSGFSFGAPAAPTSASGFSLTPSTTTSSTLKLGATTAPSLSVPVITTTPTVGGITATAPASAVTFGQLEESLNKWTLELEEQEKIFMNQAAQINNSDNLLNSNSDKIVALNNEVAAMKLAQQQMDHELDFILAQQKELEEVLAPLERQAAETPANSDPEREHCYHMAETLDTQLKQMSEDLREIIEHLNESSRTQDNSDPIVQVGRILNAHMGSLQWIDQMTLNIQNQLENVSKLHDIHRRENERSFRISYE